jgi:nucleoid DNA-binding protein
MKNKNNLDYDDLCNLIANEIQHKASVESVKRYLHGLYKVILRQLELNQRIYIKGFGTFEVKERKSGERLINNPKNNKKQIYYVKPRKFISFKAASKFSHSINEGDFKLISDEKDATLRRMDRKVPINIHTNTIVDLLNIAERRKKKRGY